MYTQRNQLIETAKSPRLRVGIKWDPLDRDTIGEVIGHKSSKEVRQEIASLNKSAKNQIKYAKYLRMSYFFRNRAFEIERALEQTFEKKKTLEAYLSQEKLKSHDLDLCCFAYDKDGNLVKYVLPDSVETKESREKGLAFMHSGDDETGTGEAFDEEILVSLPHIDPAISYVFFVILSVNTGFDDVVNGYWSVVNTSGEKRLQSFTLETGKKDQIHVMTRLTRSDLGWELQKIAEFCTPEDASSVPAEKKVDAYIRDHYLAKKKAA